MCYRPIHISRPSNGFLAYDVPCGHCSQCLQAKRDSYLFRNITEYNSCGGRALFVTLTYSNKYLPHVYTEDIPPVYDDNGVLVADYQPTKRISCWRKDDIKYFTKSINDSLKRLSISRSTGLPRLVSIAGKQLKNPLFVEAEKQYKGRPLKYFCTCERGKIDRYRSRTGRYRFGTKRPHYHMILFIQDKTLSSEDVLDCIKSTWYFGLSYTEPLDRSHASCIQYVTKYVIKDKKDPLFSRDLKPLKYPYKRIYELYDYMRTCRDSYPFVVQSHFLGIEFLDYLRSLSIPDLIKKIQTGSTITTGSGRARQINIPQYYLNKLTKTTYDSIAINKNWFCDLYKLDYDIMPNPIVVYAYNKNSSKSTKSFFNIVGNSLSDISREKKIERILWVYSILHQLYPIHQDVIKDDRFSVNINVKRFEEYLRKRNIDFDPKYHCKEFYEKLIQGINKYLFHCYETTYAKKQSDFKNKLTEAITNKPNLFLLSPL